MAYQVITERKSDGAPVVRDTLETWEAAHGEAVWIHNDENTRVEIWKGSALIWTSDEIHPLGKKDYLR